MGDPCVLVVCRLCDNGFVFGVTMMDGWMHACRREAGDVDSVGRLWLVGVHTYMYMYVHEQL